MDDDRRLRAWERRTSVPLLLGSALFLACYAVLVLDPGMGRTARDAFTAALLAAWAGFGADYLVRLALAPRPGRFLRTRWLDLVVLVLPLLRPLRMVQAFARTRRRAGGGPRPSLEVQVIAYTGLTTLLLGFAGSLAVYQAERTAPGANVRDYGDAVWFACSTLTGVGYGDVFPVTWRGRTVAVGMMLIGLGLLGAVISTFSSWLVGRFRVAARPPGS